jgi:hypothetical protein
VLDKLTLLVKHCHVMDLAGPVPSDVHGRTSVLVRDNENLVGAEGPGRELIGRPSPRLVPNAGQRPSAHLVRQYSCRPSIGSPAWPWPGGHRRLRPSLNQAAAGMVRQ